MSVSRELVQDARRDLADVGCRVDVHDGAEALDRMSSHGGKNGKGLGAGGSLGKGVLFVTYSLLVSGRRMEEIVSWLSGGAERSYAGVIVFDEAHKAKNLEADTRTARLVVALQERLPMARVLYCSATGVSDIKHMAYATRLGLWGGANPLYPTFESFHGALAKRGVGAMEMLALEMKRKGLFLARTLSWDGAEFHTLEVTLSEEATRRYDGAGKKRSVYVRFGGMLFAKFVNCLRSMIVSFRLHRTYLMAATSTMVAERKERDKLGLRIHEHPCTQAAVVNLLVRTSKILTRDVHMREN